MARLILDNRSELPMESFLEMARQIVSSGRISNDGKAYSYLTSFHINNKEYHVVSDLNEKSDKLTLYKPDLNGQ